MSRPWNEHGEPLRLIQKTRLSSIMWDAFTLWQVPPQRRWIIWTRRSRMDSDSASGWRTIRIGIPCAASRDSKRCCESFDAAMPAMQESHLHLEIAHVLFIDVCGHSKAGGKGGARSDATDQQFRTPAPRYGTANSIRAALPKSTGQ